MAAMLQTAHARGVVPDYITRLLAAFPERLEARSLRLEAGKETQASNL
jgi:hypothetical protein